MTTRLDVTVDNPTGVASWATRSDPAQSILIASPTLPAGTLPR